MSEQEYWIGQNVDYKGVWSDYNSGIRYVNKFNDMRVHLIRIKLENPPASLPLFNHDAVYKTFKGYFHDIKKTCFSDAEYNKFGPLFLYSINRGSGIWEFLGELTPLLIFGWAIKNALVLGQSIKNQDEKLKLITKHFPDVKLANELLDKFFKAQTPEGLAEAVSMLYQQKIKEVQISQDLFDPNNMKQTLKDI